MGGRGGVKSPLPTYTIQLAKNFQDVMVVTIRGVCEFYFNVIDSQAFMNQASVKSDAFHNPIVSKSNT